MDSDESDSDSDDCDLTTRITNISTEDPLEDVFGTDADTWSEIRDTQYRGLQHPNIVNLPLHAAELSGTGGDSFEHDYGAEFHGQKEEDEVRELLDAMARPRLSVTVTPSPSIRDEGQLAGTTSLSIKKHVPPPLVLPPRREVAVIDDQHSPQPASSASANGPYLVEGYDDFRGNDTLFSVSSDGAEDEFSRFRRPNDDKRDAGVFDGLDLGLEEFENVSSKISASFIALISCADSSTIMTPTTAGKVYSSCQRNWMKLRRYGVGSSPFVDIADVWMLRTWPNFHLNDSRLMRPWRIWSNSRPPPHPRRLLVIATWTPCHHTRSLRALTLFLDMTSMF
jgi:hypothetical protein